MATKQMIQPTIRTYQNENDYWHIREFLRAVSLINDRHDYSWDLLRWDYWVWHVNMNICHFQLEDVITLWETDGQIIAMLNPDTNGEAFFQFNPAFRSAALFNEMLDVAESELPNEKEDGSKELISWVNEPDTLFKDILTRRGYTRSKFKAEHMRRRFISTTLNAALLRDQQTSSPSGIPDSVPQGGYTVRSLGDESELPARSWLSWKVFHPDEPDEKYQGWEWYKNVQHIPLYNRDLDIVAVAPDGELAAFCTIWVDQVTHTAVFEPVGTHPDHQRRGLGKAVMSEGLRRAQKLGATLATVSSYSDGAHALYHSMGFTEFDLLEPWIKEW